MERRLQRENLNGAGETFEDIKQMDLSGEKPLGEAKTAKTKTSNFDYHKERVTGRGTAGGCRAGLPQARSEN